MRRRKRDGEELALSCSAPPGRAGKEQAPSLPFPKGGPYAPNALPTHPAVPEDRSITTVPPAALAAAGTNQKEIGGVGACGPHLQDRHVRAVGGGLGEDLEVLPQN